MQTKYIIIRSIAFVLLGIASLSHAKPFLLQQRYVITFDRAPKVTPISVDHELDAFRLDCYGARLLNHTTQGEVSECTLLTSEQEGHTVIHLHYPNNDYAVTYYHADGANGSPTVVIELRSKQMLEQLKEMSFPVLWYS